MAEEAAAALPANLPCTAPIVPWTAEIARLRQVELHQAERLVAAG